MKMCKILVIEDGEESIKEAKFFGIFQRSYILNSKEGHVGTVAYPVAVVDLGHGPFEVTLNMIEEIHYES